MSDYHLEALSVDLPRKSPLAFLRRASAADAKSISDEEQEALAEQEEEMDDHQQEALSTDLPEDNLQLALRRASAADAKSLSEEGEQALAEQEEEMNNPLAFLHRSSAADAKSLSGEDQGLAAGLKQKARTTQAIRTAAYRDAINVVAREMQRRGQNLTCWTAKDAEAAREIAEILIGLHSQGVTASDPAFAR
jgi:hypothetical protein